MNKLKQWVEDRQENGDDGVGFKDYEMPTNAQWMKYTFICDPDMCDALVEVSCKLPFDFPNGEVAMNCPCGRKMMWITSQEIVGFDETF